MMGVAGRAMEMIRALTEEEGYELVHVEYLWEGKSPVLRAYIDRPGGVTISDCAELSRRISVMLDVEDFIPTSYMLEVSSPGLERPLFSADDYRRFTGRLIKLSTIRKIENRRNFKGVIESFEDGTVRMNCDGRVYLIPLEEIKRANLVYDFG